MIKRTLCLTTILVLLSFIAICCHRGEQTAQPNSAPPAASPSSTEAQAIPITLPVLDALFADQKFTADLKSKLQVTDEQVSALRKISSDEVSKLRRGNAENQAGSAEAARQSAIEAIRGIIGAEKSEQLMALAREHWIKGSEEVETAAAPVPQLSLLPGPNAVPTDTRVVVNIPAFRMDVFRDGTLIKSYKIGIGYPQFPLPQGLRKAQLIIFNPTWTPPDSPWVASMKNVSPGETVGAGSKLNPLGPIKIPIGMPSLIHGGKTQAKIGNFASHGCVGMTNAQVRDFARVLAEASHTELAEQTLSGYLKNRTKTRVVNLGQLVPVELRYETIVFEDGQLHIYRDVYDQNTNTEEKLRAVLSANGVSLDDLTTEEHDQAIDAVNAMSRQPKKRPAATKSSNANQNPERSVANTNQAKPEPPPARTVRNQREMVVEIATLKGKGYPAPVNLDTGVPPQVVAATTSNKPE
jgi:lipoprotein-anchoring transpeptidase ErfK/SrfK